MRQLQQQNVNEVGSFGETRKVLIFDEDIEDLNRLSEPFEASGLEVHKCMSVETAKRCVEREEFDFALVDQGSPAFEGLRVIRHLVRYNLHTPFVVVARRRDALCYEQALAAGATDYLEKPVSASVLGWIIRNFLDTGMNE